MAFVYVLQSLIKDWKYIGCTEDKTQRLGYHKSTRPYRPFKIIYSEEFATLMGLLPNAIFAQNELVWQNSQKNLSAYLSGKHQNLF